MNLTKVLVVENELLIANDISLILEEEGFEVIIGVTSVTSALQILNEDKFDLVLIDINLEGELTGIEVGKYLLQADTTPYIYITALYDSETIQMVKVTRPHGILIKPFKPIDLITTTSIVLNNYFFKNIDVIRNTGNQLIDESEIPFVLKKVISFIDNNILEKIELNDLVKMTKWGSVHFNNVFVKYLGVTPYKYLINRKIEQAKLLIDHSDLNIMEIAIDLGFESYSSFYKAFKNYTGFTPEKYKKAQLFKKHLK